MRRSYLDALSPELLNNISAKVIEDGSFKFFEASLLLFNGALAGTQKAQVTDDLGLLIHFLFNEPGTLLGIQAWVQEHTSMSEGHRFLRV